MSAAPALAVRDVRYAYAGRRREARSALRGVTLSLPAARATALLGPNGSGKSTLLRVVAGMLREQSGSVAVAGATRPHARRARLGAVFQRPALDPELTVLETLRDHAVLYGLPRAEAAARIESDLEALGLADRARSRVRTLSGGLARRVDLARALLPRPALLLLDEPTSGLDPAARASFLDTLAARRARDGLAVLLATHLVDEAERCDRVVMLHEGRIVADDAPAALRAGLGRHRITVHDARADVPALAPVDTGGWHRAAAGWTLALGGPDDPAATTAIGALVRTGTPFTVAPPTLADAFETLTESSLDG